MTNKPIFSLAEFAKLSISEAMARFQTTNNGYTPEQVESARATYGTNKLESKSKFSGLRLLLSAFSDPFTLLLFVIAVVSFLTDYVFAEDKSLSSSLVILIILFVSGMLQYVQEIRSHTSAEKLSQMVKSTIVVLRDGKQQLIPIEEVVVGDLLLLSSGDMIPADLRLLESKDLFIGQSALTGESEPIAKYSTDDGQAKNEIDLENIVYMGTNVISGSALALVINTGRNTMLGGIAKSLEKKPTLTSFDRELRSISWIFIRLMLFVVPAVFLLHGIHGKDWLESFVFAITIAVGLTPAMLPTVVSVNQARNASELAKKKVIVKNLNSIQNLGSMDILCTDKTGTLTLDKVTLMHVYNTLGAEDSLVARYAFLNSYYQTGLRNLLDEAVIDYSHKVLPESLATEYQKVNEIPFDFTRRRMSVVVRSHNRALLITKGALEEVISACSSTYEEEIIPLADEKRQAYSEQVAQYNRQGLRVVAVAIREFPLDQEDYSPQDETDMILMGFLAFLDPPKETAKQAIADLQQNGIQVMVLTGDNPTIAQRVCQEVGIPSEKVLTGREIEQLSDEELLAHTHDTYIYAKLTPDHKLRVVTLLQKEEHTVGYMGDGINDAASLRQADVGISVDSGVDIAKESANIILLENDLTVLLDGVTSGRKAHVNIMKYIKTTVSINVGYMLTMLLSSFLLPFFPMLPTQLLIFNLIYDISSLGVPWDRVDPEQLASPIQQKPLSLNRFMVWFGPITTIADFAAFGMLFFLLIPQTLGAAYSPGQGALFTALFQTSWFVSSLWTQFIFIHLIRTPKVPFLQSRSSWLMLLLSLAGPVVGTIMPYSPIGKYFSMVPIPLGFFPYFLLLFIGYVALTLVAKYLYIKKYHEFL